MDYRSEPTLYYGNPWGAYEEYWYDALGRRVLKRSRQSSPVCTYPGRCHSSITRFVWDGNQILWEVRQADGYNKDIQDPSGGSQTGNFGYVHAGGIDAPLGMVRNGSTVVLHRNWRGLYAFATDENGDQLTCAPQSFSGCDDVSWPGGTWNLQRGHIDPHGTQTWYGSVSMGQQDRTGLLYQRNRYYDSSTGQFTQQDPIGIAGGLNVYGYANGDPVNFHDPFGLDCEEKAESFTQAKSKECDPDDEEGLFDRLRAWRARKNQSDLTTPDEVSAAGGYEVAAWMNVLHQNGGAWDTKMLLPDGRFSSKEFIFDGDSGELITGPKGGTYNIVNPMPPGRGTCSTQIQCFHGAVKMYASWIGHTLADVILN